MSKVRGRCHYCNQWGILNQRLIGKAIRMFCNGCKHRAAQEAKGVKA